MATTNRIFHLSMHESKFDLEKIKSTILEYGEYTIDTETVNRLIIGLSKSSISLDYLLYNGWYLVSFHRFSGDGYQAAFAMKDLKNRLHMLSSKK